MDCPKCWPKTKMIRKKHTKNFKYNNHTYFFTEWDLCPKCKYIQHYEEFKMKPNENNLKLF